MNKTDIQTQNVAASGTIRTPSGAVKRKAAQVFATCAMGAWVVLAVTPFLVVLVELGHL
ncbi:hypothetical protein GOB93_14880 [Acetobacter musti]|uniref:Uncharacterized protein n=1 Tax=Acetobacter musti TaxID=864732 RepID=A0ABX0JRV6_9PROT|nr:hypothetical protein [Acetobacter musti]NHN85916.1 hypothetical protein [Acetobacter musti]